MVAALALAGCASGDDDSSSATTSGGGSATTGSASGPAPGVTADSIKIGVTYVDTKALAAVNLNYDLGDHEATYKALFDDINAKGGINGRKIEPIIAPVDPSQPASSDAACLKLTEDDDVFLVTGFFLTTAVSCPVGTHATATVGGGMTPDLLTQAKAPWLTWAPDTDQPKAVVDAFAKRGELDGKVGVFASAADEEQMNDFVLPELDKLGIKAVETGIMDAPVSDVAAVEANVNVIAEKFKSAGVDTVLIVGIAGANWPLSMADNPYSPHLLFTDVLAARAFATNKSTTDTSILKGSLSAGGYGPDQARFDEPKMQECVKVLRAAGVKTPSPNESGSDVSNQPYQAAFQACPDVALIRAWLQAAGKNLNYGTLESAIDGLKVTIPGDPTERTYGPPPAADGNPTVYFFNWDESKKEFAVDESKK